MADKFSQQLPLYTVDSFTAERFGGNPAAVCLLEHGDISDDLCQKIAFEMNLSETAFIKVLDKAQDFKSASRFGLRWFTPLHEVSLCGHATLASAHVLFNVLGNQHSSVCFENQFSGKLVCDRKGQYIKMDFPIWDVVPMSNRTETVQRMAEECAGGLPIKELQFCNACDERKLIVVLDDKVTKAQLESIKANTQRLLSFDPSGNEVRMVDVTVKGSKETGALDRNGHVYDFMSRVFCPYWGIPEDPVCGSAHCALGNYWSKVLGKKGLYARHCSQRGGELRLLIRDDGRIDIEGQAVTVLQGSISI